MTEEEFVAAARARYQQIHNLGDKHPDSFYDYEVAYAEIWKDLGRQVLESMISKPTNDRRKKKQS